MAPRLNALERSLDRQTGLLVAVTVVFVVLDGMLTAYQYHLEEFYQNQLALSAIEWGLYTVGPLLFEPILLFGVLYFLSSRTTPTVRFARLLPALVLAVVVGNLVGQWVGMSLWRPAAFGLPLGIFRSYPIFHPDGPVLRAWVLFLEPIARDLLTVLAAIGVGRTVGGERATSRSSIA